MKLLVGVPTAELGKQAIFYDYLRMIRIPQDSFIISPHGQSPARARNMIIEAAIQNDCTHILFLDDDTCPPADIFEKLLSHDKDMVTGIYFMRNFPHQPILFDEAYEDGKCRFWYPEDNYTEELVPVIAAGLGAALIKTSVFEAMERPWITLGELEKDHWCDDISFYLRAKKAGFQLYCDLSVRCGHMATVTLTPKYVDGKWTVSYNTNGTSEVTFPLSRPTLVSANA